MTGIVVVVVVVIIVVVVASHGSSFHFFLSSLKNNLPVSFLVYMLCFLAPSLSNKNVYDMMPKLVFHFFLAVCIIPHTELDLFPRLTKAIFQFLAPFVS